MTRPVPLAATLARTALALAALVLASVGLAACASGPVDVETAESVALDLDKARPGRLAAALLGGLAGGGPFERGLLSGDDDALRLHPQRLDATARAALRDADGDGAIGWDEFAAFVEAAYPATLPATLDAARREAGFTGDGAWTAVEIDGSVMTTARRRVLVSHAALERAMDAFAADGVLAYPAGTWILGEHLGADGAVLETTAKRRRADGSWDFAVYDSTGALAPATTTEPRPLRAPLQCTGCHLGQKLYEPEKSYPAAATEGPFGPRAYRVEDAARSAQATALFQEHARRQDGVLGLYATVYAGRLMQARAEGTATPDETALLERLGL